MLNVLVTVIFSLIAIKGIGSAFRGVLLEERTQVDAFDLIAAGVFLLAGAGVAVFTLWNFHDLAPLWFWPIIALSVGGLTSSAVRCALGIPLTGRLNSSANESSTVITL